VGETRRVSLSSNTTEGKNIHCNNWEAAMQPTEVIIPIVFFITIGVIWGAFILTRHRERVMIIEKGLKPEDMKALYTRSVGKPNALSSLKWGMVFVAIGLAVLIGMYLHETYYVDEGVFPGLIALLGGAGLIVFYLVAGRRAHE
jgi:hypothetical protein